MGKKINRKDKWRKCITRYYNILETTLEDSKQTKNFLKYQINDLILH